jgi:hypothetical protein
MAIRLNGADDARSAGGIYTNAAWAGRLPRQPGQTIDCSSL